MGVEEILVEESGMSAEEAIELIEEVKELAVEMQDFGVDLCEVEEMVATRLQIDVEMVDEFLFFV